MPLRPFVVVAAMIALSLLADGAHARQAFNVDRVIHISIDGLHYAAIESLELAGEQVPNFVRLRDDGSSTDNARTDPFLANTLPNHASQFTGRAVFGADGHGWYINEDPPPPSTLTLHDFKGQYVASVFDVVHDHGGSTALFASKEKFAIFERSWNLENDAPDFECSNDGQNKIHVCRYQSDITLLVNDFVKHLESIVDDRRYYAFLHLRQPDSAGHDYNWDLTSGSVYLDNVKKVDIELGRIMNAVTESKDLRDRTAIILTSDHGGILQSKEHFIVRFLGIVDSGIVPFYVWNPDAGIEQGKDLYDINFWRLDPGRWLPYRLRPFPPVRNGDSANLALDLLGLPPVPGSTINAHQTLWVGQ